MDAPRRSSKVLDEFTKLKQASTLDSAILIAKANGKLLRIAQA